MTPDDSTIQVVTPKALEVAIVGAGARGTTFARLISELPHLGKVVAVAEPRREVREAFAQTHGLAKDRAFDL